MLMQFSRIAIEILVSVPQKVYACALFFFKSLFKSLSYTSTFYNGIEDTDRREIHRAQGIKENSTLLVVT